MNKAKNWIIGWYSCLSWMVGAIVREYCPELKFWNIPTHPNDFVWYAERINGRLAMLAVTVLLSVELLNHKSIWELIGVF